MICPARNNNSTMKTRWAAVIAYILFIFISLPLFPALWRLAYRHIPVLLHSVTLYLLPCTFLCLFCLCIWHFKIRSILLYAQLATIAAAFIAVQIFMCDYPAERLHLTEYVVLPVLLYRALSLTADQKRVFLYVILLSAATGLLDELIQGLLPNRYYEFKDAGLNWIASLLGTGIIAAFIRNGKTKRKA